MFSHFLPAAASFCLAALSVAAGSPDTSPAELRPVSLELVLAIDCSLSVDDQEFALERRGIAAAFRDEEVVAAILARTAGVAVTLVQWDGTPNDHQEPGWYVLHDRQSIADFAHAVERTPRANLGYETGIGYAIDFSRRLLLENKYAGDELKIDISGDGRSNSGPAPNTVRETALAQGIIINGLAILDGDPTLLPYYKLNVSGGTGSFAMAANHYQDFADAFLRKLRRELQLEVTRL